MRSGLLKVLIIAISLGLGGGTARAQTPTETVAEVNGHKITRAELEQKEAGKLLKIRTQYYQAERDALNQFIDDYLLEAKANQEHLTVDELVKRDIESQVQDPTEDQLKVYYEGVGTEEPYAAVRDKILGYIRQHRLSRARAEYLKGLRDHAGVLISMAPPTTDVPVNEAPLRGVKDASIRIIEYTDYECPYCQQANPALKKLEKDFDGKIAVIHKDFPLPMHKRAEKAAEAARCAGAQGHFWEVHDWLFEGTAHLELTQIKEYARTLKLDAERFDKCLDSGEQAAAVQTDLAEATRLGLSGTPSFFLNGHFFSGIVNYDTLREMVEQESAGGGPSTHSSR